MATVAENLQAIIDIKEDIKEAIIEKGVSVADSDGFDSYASKIGEIQSEITMNCEKLTTLEDCWYNIPINNITLLNTNNITNMASTFYGSGLKSINSDIITTNVIKMRYMFNGCSITSVPLFDTSNVTDMFCMFRWCDSLTSVPLFDTSKVTDMNQMFYGCRSITTIPQFDTSNVTDMYQMFYNCDSLTTIPQLNASNVKKVWYTFSGCDKLTNFGGLVNIGQAFSNTDNYNYHRFELYESPLTYQSCMNVINNLYDVTLVNVNDATLILSTYSYSLLSPEDIAIATNKGWIVNSRT